VVEVAKLKVDLGELAMAFEDASLEQNYYLDLETGQVVWVSQETYSLLESIYEVTYDPEAEDLVDLATVLQDHDLADWQEEELLEADRVERFYGSRYIRVPEADSHEAYRDMERFISTIQDERLQNRLWQAIQGRGAFRRFKDVLAGAYREQKRWYAFQHDQLHERLLGWLESEGIEPIIPEPAPAEYPEPETPTAREQLLAEALAFVRAASRLRGVIRIALIGSLATEEPDPKDVDLLVTVTDDMDLASLARLGRKLQGHAQSFARGGEVFLADPRGHYLGRTCPWKRCGPGIRINCDALHCGRRPYLHDDLETISLDETLILASPIELWPQIVARVPVPHDVQQELLLPLREKQGE
jgi:predicted nucleotidyltransferase